MMTAIGKKLVTMVKAQLPQLKGLHEKSSLARI